MMSKQFKTRAGIILGTFLGLTLIGVLFGLAWPVTTVEAGATLPPRDRGAEQGDSGGGDGDSSDSGPTGASIELHTAGVPAGAWAVVQWQDSAGGWHDVAGWQGPVGTNGYQQWWVAAKDFGTGPFQWTVKQGSDGPVWGNSAPFNLPGRANEILRVEIVAKQ